MILCDISEKHGHINISFCVDHHRLETWFEVSLALYSNDTFKGLYKKYTFSTYRAAHNKMEYLQAKHGFRVY